MWRPNKLHPVTSLDLMVVSDIVMSETARLAHDVLPCRNGYESWDGTFFAWSYTGVYFQMRQPLVEPPGDIALLS